MFGACLLPQNMLFLMDLHNRGMIVPRYISMATGDVMSSIGLPSTRSTNVLYLWLYTRIDSFSPCHISLSFLIAWVVVGMSLNICKTLSTKSFLVMFVSNDDKKFWTTNPNLFVSSCWKERPDCLQMFLIRVIHSRHFSGSSP